PEQYAGQLMRCPLCQGTFTVPTMPSTVAAESAEPVGFFAPPPKAETYAVSAEQAAAAAPTLPPISAETPSAASGPAPAVAASAPPPAPSAGFSRNCTMRFNPHVIQWLPLGLVLSFLLTFFPWISVLDASRNAWNIGFGESKQTLIIL